MIKPTILVATTTRWVPTARLVMALAEAGFNVEALCPSNHPLNTTGIARRSHIYNGIRPLGSFGSAIRAASPDLIVPGDDLATKHLHRLHDLGMGRECDGAMICALIERSLGAHENFPIVFARAPFLELARELGLRAPFTEVIRGSDDLRTWASDTGFPLVLKSNGTSGGDGVKIVHNLEEAERAFRSLAAPPLLARAAKRTLLDRDSTLLAPSLLRRRSVVNAQVFIRGHEATSAIVCWNGAVLASLHFDVIHKAKPTGHATVLRTFDNDEMSAAVERLVDRLHLSGFYGFDFMLDAETGNAHLIEINPRSTQAGHLTLGLGRDLPAALYATVTGEVIKPAPKTTDNDIIALFPQEWIRDAASPVLRSGYHDVPWQEPGLVRACVLSHRTQRAWYSSQGRT